MATPLDGLSPMDDPGKCPATHNGPKLPWQEATEKAEKNAEVVIRSALGIPLKLGSFWVNYDDLTATSLRIMVNMGNHPLFPF